MKLIVDRFESPQSVRRMHQYLVGTAPRGEVLFLKSNVELSLDEGVTIRNNMGGHGPSTDGIDVDSSRQVLIERCDIDCNDKNFSKMLALMPSPAVASTTAKTGPCAMSRCAAKAG